MAKAGNLAWTEEAQKQYLARENDFAVHQAFDDLVDFITDDPRRGRAISELDQSEHPVEKRIREAIRDISLPSGTRIVSVTVRRPKGASPPPLIAVAFVINTPNQGGADHTLVTLGLVYRQPGPLR